MGYNSVVMICNDAIGEIEKDPEGWWKETWAALNSEECVRGDVKEYGFGNHCNAFKAVHNRHADEITVFVIGANHAARVGSARWPHWRNYHTVEGQAEIIKDMARRFGYHLVKLGPKQLKPLRDAAARKIGEKFFSTKLRQYHAEMLEHLEGLIG